MTVKEALEKALKLIKRGWTKDDFAKNKNNRSCSPFSSKAVKWCAAGAITRVCDNNYALRHAVQNCLTDLLNLQIHYWNDHATKKDVIAGFQKAIESVSNA